MTTKYRVDFERPETTGGWKETLAFYSMSEAEMYGHSIAKTLGYFGYKKFRIVPIFVDERVNV